MTDQATAFSELLAINEKIGVAESNADKAWFDQLLHERFTMRRPGGQLSTKDEFIAGLAHGAERRTIMLDIEVHGEYRASSRCTVKKWMTAQPDDVQTFDNLRIFVREADRWQLITWLAEPI